MKREYFIDPFMINLYNANILKKGNDMDNIFYTLNNEYVIKLFRYETRIWNTELSYKYICKFEFYNNLNIKVFEFTCSEMDIFILLDNIYGFEYNNLKEVYIGFNTSNYNMYFSRDENIYELYHLSFELYDENTKSHINRLSFDLDEDSLCKFIDLVYFIFLLDIDFDNMNRYTKELLYEEYF